MVFYGSRFRGYIIYFVAKPTSSKGVIISVCRVVKDRFIGRKGRYSNGYVLDQVLYDEFRVTRRSMYIVEGLIWFVVWVVESIVEVQCDIQEVDNFKVGGYRNGQSNIPEEDM